MTARGILGRLAAQLRQLPAEAVQSPASALFSPLGELDLYLDVECRANGHRLADAAMVTVRKRFPSTWPLGSLYNLADGQKRSAIQSIAFEVMSEMLVGFDVSKLVDEARALNGNKPLSHPAFRDATAHHFVLRFGQLVNLFAAQAIADPDEVRRVIN